LLTGSARTGISSAGYFFLKGLKKMDISMILAGLLSLGVCKPVEFDRKVEDKTLVVITCPVLVSPTSPIQEFLPKPAGTPTKG